MARRFEPVRPTPQQLSDGLNAIDYTARQFAYVTGSDVRRVERWLNDPAEADHIPQWVAGFLAALGHPEVRLWIEAWADGEVE